MALGWLGCNSAPSTYLYLQIYEYESVLHLSPPTHLQPLVCSSDPAHQKHTNIWPFSVLAICWKSWNVPSYSGKHVGTCFRQNIANCTALPTSQSIRMIMNRSCNYLMTKALSLTRLSKSLNLIWISGLVDTLMTPHEQYRGMLCFFLLFYYV